MHARHAEVETCGMHDVLQGGRSGVPSPEQSMAFGEDMEDMEEVFASNARPMLPPGMVGLRNLGRPVPCCMPSPKAGSIEYMRTPPLMHFARGKLMIGRYCASMQLSSTNVTDLDMPTGMPHHNSCARGTLSPHVMQATRAS